MTPTRKKKRTHKINQKIILSISYQHISFIIMPLIHTEDFYKEIPMASCRRLACGGLKLCQVEKEGSMLLRSRHAFELVPVSSRVLWRFTGYKQVI